MAIIVPAILEKNIDGFKDRLAILTKLEGVARIQVDFADGIFVPNTTLSVVDIDSLSPAFVWEAHLMIQNPSDFLEYQIAGFKVIIVHYEAFEGPARTVLALKEIKKLGMKAALALSPATPISSVVDMLPFVDQVLLMGIEPGFQGRDFLPDTISRTAGLRQLVPHGILEIDGGIKAAEVKPLIRAGADLLVVGSALFETEKVQENFDILTKETIV